jgi:hypothetical protein
MQCIVVSRVHLNDRDWYDVSQLQKCKCKAHAHVFDKMRSKPVSAAVIYGAANSMRCTKRGTCYSAPGQGTTWLLDATFIDQLTPAEAAEIRRQHRPKETDSAAETPEAPESPKESPAPPKETPAVTPDAPVPPKETHETPESPKETPAESPKETPAESPAPPKETPAVTPDAPVPPKETHETPESPKETPAESPAESPKETAVEPAEVPKESRAEASAPPKETPESAAETPDETSEAPDALPPIIKATTELYTGMFRMKDGRSVELRGQQGVLDSIRIKAADLEELWGIRQIRSTIRGGDYTLGTDFWNLRTPNKLSATGFFDQIYVSYPAMMRLAERSTKKIARAFVRWVAEVVCIAHTGTDEQRAQVGGSIVQGVPIDAVIAHHQKTACGELKVLYLASLGLVLDLRTSLGILTAGVPDHYVVFKVGKSERYVKRLQDHRRGLGSLAGVVLIVLFFFFFLE